MAGRLPLQGSEYYLPEETYRMVQHFCYSYKEMKQEAMDIQSLKSPVIDDMPRGTGVSNPTERDGMRLAELDRKCRIIEDAVRDVCPEGWKWLFLGVTDRTASYRELRVKYGIPYGHNIYGRMKKLVYWKVSKKI